MCWIAWSKMTTSKRDGGLGFRDINNFNDALLAKVSWRILIKPNCLLARILTGKYCKSSSFLDCSVSTTASHGWRGICIGRDLLKTQLGRAIGSGTTTRVWKDPWLSLESPLTPMGPPAEQDQCMTVANLLCPISKTWNREKILRTLPQYEQEILAVRPSKMGAPDRYVWLPSISGDYSAKSGYHAAANMELIGKKQAHNSGEFNWSKEIWDIQCLPKVKFLLWKAMKNALPVGENLKSRGINPLGSCPHCGEEESCLHLFFHCRYSQQVWSQAPFKLPVTLVQFTTVRMGLESFKKMVCLPPSGIESGNLCPWIMWMIWVNRNKKIFEQKQFSSLETLTQAIIWAKEWISAQLQPSRTQDPRPIRRDLVMGVETVRCFSDAAWRKESKEAGFGWLFLKQGSYPIA